ncbi:copper-translocating P-type ATPase [Rhodobacteraceae bacterium F11138]|nr:copper-translocating P-type ATPase [Rhodobacteraceae bacterium F11138]
MTQTTHMEFSVQGLTCASCVARAETALRAVPGVRGATVNLATRTAQLDMEAGHLPDVRQALKTAGYPMQLSRQTLQIQGMTCAGCVARVEDALGEVPGVLEVSVNFAMRQADVQFAEGAVARNALIRAVRDAGYEAGFETAEDDGAQDRADQEIAQARRLTLIALGLTLPVFVMEMGGHLFPQFHHLIARTIGQHMSWLIQFVLTTAVLIGPGAVFFRKGVPALLRGHPDMNSLVALGAFAAWAFSSVALFVPGALPPGAQAVYFEAAAVIVALILLGRWLEARARGRAGAAIQRLVGLQPRTARVDRDGETAEVEIDSIAVGDILQLRPGERVAVDGAVLDGRSHVDESMITGEPAPVAKGQGDWLVGGTVNGSGVLRYRAERIGRDTMLARIIQMVQQAQGAKLPIQAVADKVVRIFVPIVIAVAVLTVGAWLMFGPDPKLGHALVAGVSVLIIACPCAMGLATPTSVMVGSGRGAEIGVLFRRGDALQSLSRLRMIAFDKTGTLTMGQPALTDLRCAADWSDDAVLALIAAAEAQSEHPIAHAVLAAARDRDLQLRTASQVEALNGAGLRARVEGRTILIGSARLLRDSGVDAGDLAADAQALQEQGKTPVLAAIDGQIVAVLGVSDPIKPGTRSALQHLRDDGVRIAMITGDAKGTAQAIAAELGISEVMAEVLPDGKRDAVMQLRRQFGAVGFVGDGINDAPALAEADVGLAIGKGTDVAIESADVVLVSGDLAGVVNALHVSRATLRNIRQNLFWAFAYNAVLIPVAAGVLYPAFGVLLSPMLAAAAMALSSVFVLGNALRLRALRPVQRDSDTETPQAMSDPSPIAAK